MKHIDLLQRLKAIDDMWGLVQCRERDALRALIRELEAETVEAEEDGPISFAQIDRFKRDGELRFDHGMKGYPTYPDCHVQVTRA